jgi:hypothetical protein
MVWIGAMLIAFVACRVKRDAAQPAVEAPPASATNATAAQAGAPNPAPQNAAGAISAARDQLQRGNVDAAAAKLAQLQVQGASFNAQQAKDYRQALSEAYDRAIEAMERGDPKGQAALQLLRAAAPR